LGDLTETPYSPADHLDWLLRQLKADSQFPVEVYVDGIDTHAVAAEVERLRAAAHDDWGTAPEKGHEYDDLIAALPGHLRSRICHDEMYCPVPERDFDHGHTNCLLFGLAAAEIESLRAVRDEMYDYLKKLVKGDPE